MIHAIDPHRLNILHETPFNYASATELRREGKVFFIGGNLPVYNTLETMYESYCQENTELFHITFGDAGAFERNLDMVRQIKRNFSIRLMGQASYPLSASQVEQVYLAGLDVLDIPQKACGNSSVGGTEGDGGSSLETFNTVASTFSPWSIVSTIIVEQTEPEQVRSTINCLLSHGFIPLLALAGGENGWNQPEARDLFNFLAAEWHRHKVPLKPIIPLLRLATPFVFGEPSGLLRNVIHRLGDRGGMAASDIRRHLRTNGAVGSFESAGL